MYIADFLFLFSTQLCTLRLSTIEPRRNHFNFCILNVLEQNCMKDFLTC